ncbi:SNG1 family protein [Streptacidiphilus sp. ASG 303]|uniref:SNG1 family protein n=1 Tax=Streptacidiphilus sp. ASG 303 TaxID=2896847 RepID=UPI001E294CFD|nr:SNG1 family protein [Streptacidiphilus sp. ASG 303]MCD0485314.1 SNG1 family protein [Streptacidiphilus sp. ASG 303]
MSTALSSTTPGGPGRRGFLAELRDAVSLRAFLLMTGVLLLQVGFVVSYIGAFHSPSPHRVPVAVVAPPQVSRQVVALLNRLPGEPARATAAPSAAAARRQVLDRTVDAALLVDAAGTRDTLLVASAGGPAVSDTAAQLGRRIEVGRKRAITVTDIRPPAPADGRGLSSFYLVVGWMVGGYLASSMLAVSAGARPANAHRALVRLAVLALYAVLSGLAGAVVVDTVFHALPGHFAALWGIGALVVFAAAASSMALQTLFGTVGIGLAVLLFVVLGNPSAGGPYPSVLLPPFWRVIGPALPPGAGTTAVRNTVYFSGNATTGPLWILGAWAAGGLLVGLLASARRRDGGGVPG